MGQSDSGKTAKASISDGLRATEEVWMAALAKI
jgi:hypothetical protein